MYPRYFKNPVPPLCIVSTCVMYPRVQAKTPKICKIPGVLWPAIYGTHDFVTSNSNDVFINTCDSATSDSADACDSATSDSANVSISEFINIFTSAAGIFNLGDADDLGGNFSARTLNFDVGTALDFSLEFEFGVLAGFSTIAGSSMT